MKKMLKYTDWIMKKLVEVYPVVADLIEIFPAGLWKKNEKNKQTTFNCVIWVTKRLFTCFALRIVK